MNRMRPCSRPLRKRTLTIELLVNESPKIKYQKTFQMGFFVGAPWSHCQTLESYRRPLVVRATITKGTESFKQWTTVNAVPGRSPLVKCDAYVSFSFTSRPADGRPTPLFAARHRRTLSRLTTSLSFGRFIVSPSFWFDYRPPSARTLVFRLFVFW